MIGLEILGTGAALPERVLTTAELVTQVWPTRDPVEVERRLGISTRRWVDPSMSDAELAAAAVRGALQRAELAATDLRRLIFTSTTGGDHLCPATANDVAGLLDVDDTCDVFDVNNGCVGFLTALDIAARSVATGISPVAVVAAETWSRYVHPEEPRPYVIMGDGAAAAIVGSPRRGGGILATHLKSRAHLRGKMSTPHPGRTGRKTFIQFGASREELTRGALEAMSDSTQVVLQQANRQLSDVRWFLPHQPNGEIVDLLLAHLGIQSVRTVPVVKDLGSLGCVSIPMSIHRAFETGQVRSGDLMLMTGVGGGTAYGATLLQVRQ